MSDSAQLSRAAELRAAFDSAFAAPLETRVSETLEYVSIRLGGQPHALSLGEIAGLHSRVTIVPCPGPLPELMGLAGFRGALVPVYDLSALLGHEPAAGHWLALVKDRSVAFAFDDLDEHFRIDAGSNAPDARSGRGHYIRSIALSGDRAWPIIDLASLVSALRQRAAGAISKKE